MIFGEAFFCAPAYPKPPPRYQKKSRQLAPAPGTPILLLLRRVTQKQINPNGESQHYHRIDIAIPMMSNFVQLPTPLLFAKMSELSSICKPYDLYLAKGLFNDISNFIEGRLGLLTPQFVNFLFESK